MSIKHDRACGIPGGHITFRKLGDLAELNVYKGNRRVSRMILKLQELERMMGLVAISMGEMGYFGEGDNRHTEEPPKRSVKVG